MACQRRTVCSAKFLTGLFSGVLMGFIMGTIHLALIRSDISYIRGGEDPCANTGNRFDVADKTLRRRFVANTGMRDDLDIPRKRNSKERNPDSLDSLFNIYGGDGGGKDFDIDGVLEDRDVDTMYEIDSSRLQRMQKRAGGQIPSTNDRMNSLAVSAALGLNAKFLYVGVMTAGKYVSTRGKAILDTWAKAVPGKVELFVGDGAVSDEEAAAMNVVRLRKVNDSAYPPQKKSFMMLKYMYEQYINGYEWFMRADDDAYVKPERLEKLLRKLNSSEPLFLGQMGYGNREERGKLTLDHGENYCMGGPGMIFSREVIRRLAPNIATCLGNMYTTHEDVEVSRCVTRFAKVKCTWSYEMKELFYEHYSKRMGYIDDDDTSFGNELNSAITMHPNKKPDYHRKLHLHFLSDKIKHLQARLSKLYRDVIIEDNALGRTPDAEEYMLGVPLSLNRYRPTDGKNVLTWNLFADRTYLPSTEMPRRGTSTHLKLAAKDIILQTIEMMNRNADAKGRVISYKRINYAYARVNPIFGSEYVLDLLLHYNRYRGKKVTLPVRRHAYLQQTFGRTLMHEDANTDLTKYLPGAQTQQRRLFGSFLRKIIDPFRYMINEERPGGGIRTGSEMRSPINSKFTADRGGKSSAPTVHIIIPLSGRYSTLRRFMANLEAVAFSKGEPVSVLIMVFVPPESSQKADMRLTQQLVNDYSVRYPSCDIRTLAVAGEFSRGVALEIGASQFAGDSLLFFCDVDVVFNANFLRKCRSNTVQGETVYYPVLFSEFDPSYEAPQEKVSERQNHYVINRDAGYWRGFGYGLLCVYQSDFASTGGFDTSIKGWGLEDVDLFGKFVHKEVGDEKSPSAVTAKPFRAKDPDLIHVYHRSHCDVDLETRQLTMCRASQSSSIMSVSNLYKKWNDTNHFRDERGARSEFLDGNVDPLYAIGEDNR